MKKALLAILAVLTVAGIWLLAGANGWLGSDEDPGELRAASRPAATMAARSTVQTETARVVVAHLRESRGLMRANK